MTEMGMNAFRLTESFSLQTVNAHFIGQICMVSSACGINNSQRTLLSFSIEPSVKIDLDIIPSTKGAVNIALKMSSVYLVYM